MKDCLILCPNYAFHFEEAYELLKKGVLKGGIYEAGWELGYNRVWASWTTTLTPNRPEKRKLKLTKTYNPQDYPRYDNYDAIESKSKDIPTDYEGKIGVPLTFYKYAGYLPYEIVDKTAKLELNGKRLFERLIIRRKQL